MRLYRVIGVYSQKFQQRYIQAESVEHAIEKFGSMLERTNPDQWELIGPNNVFVKEFQGE